MARKTKKLTCIVTGRVLVLSHDYYQNKIERAGGDEQHMIDTYICKEAKGLIKRGYDVSKTRDLLNIDVEKLGLSDVSDALIEQIQLDSRIQHKKFSTFNINNYTTVRTDPDVKKFLDKVLNR